MGRRLGQHFLHRQSILERIADAACDGAACEGDPATVVEIGPGRGALTTPLLARAKRVVAIEVDPVLVHYLRGKFAAEIDEGRFAVVEGDVLKTDISALAEDFVVAGNLPYYITSPIVERVFALPRWRRAVFLVQKEVGERIAARPGVRDYGYLSVLCQSHAECSVLCDVPREAFRPPPKVESAVVVLEQRAARPDPAFLAFAATCFRHKRKNLRNNLSERYPKEVLDRTDVGRKRAEELSISELEELRLRLRELGAAQ